MQKRIKSAAFTLVELLLVVTVIGILAGITIVSYNGWRERTAVTEVRLDSDGIQAGMQDARNRANAFPVFPIGTQFDGSSNGTKAIYTQNKNVTITYARGDSSSYCVDIVSTVAPSVRLFLDTAGGNQTAKTGTCDGGESSVAPNPSETIFVFDTSAPGCTGTVQLPISSPTSGGTINWGDGGASQSLSSSLQSHTYVTPKIYTVTYSGPITEASYYNSVNAASAKCLTKVMQWGTDATPTKMNFYNASNLVYIADFPTTVTDMSNMFRGATKFNQPVNDWDVSHVVNMNEMFSGASSFNQPINNWDISNVTDISSMFVYASAFNQPLDNWDTSKVTKMSAAFMGTSFDQPINNWDTSNVTWMVSMFASSPFNQPLDNWDTSKVRYMAGMFDSNSSFNQPINTWNTSNVMNMNRMFSNASSFNQPLNNWDTAKVIDVDFMFNSSAFNQNISGWNVGKVITKTGFHDNGTPLSQINCPPSLW